MTRRGRLVAGVTAVVGVGIGVVAAAGIALVLVVGGLSFGDWDPGPGSGTDSEELTVAVAPTEGLTDGATVLVSSTAFRPHGIVGVTVCLEEALTEGEGVDACDVDGGQRFATSAAGELAAVVGIRRVITVDGVAHDCSRRPGRCLVVAADSEDFDLSGGQPIAFAPDLSPVDLVPAGERARTVRLPGTVAPAGPLAPGAEVTVVASGFMPGEPVLVAQCTESFLLVDPWEACQVPDADVSAAFSAVALRSVDQLATHADADGRVEVEVEVRASVQPLTGSAGGDCTAEAGSCALVVAAGADTQRSSYLPLTLTG